MCPNACQPVSHPFSLAPSLFPSSLFPLFIPREDAQAPKRISWAKSAGSGSDVVSKNGTLSSITTTANRPHQREPSSQHHHHLQHYPQRPPSETASIITATGSVSGYRAGPRHGASTHAVPDYGYNVATPLPRGQLANSAASSANGSPMPRTKHPQSYTQPQAVPASPRPPPLPTIVTASNISRMGGVPIMVPAQNQAGSLV